MRPDYKIIFIDLKKQLKSIEESTTNKVQLAENCINICIVFIEKLKQIIISSNFENQADEIFFFKEIKPPFVAQLIYYTKIYHIELYMPTGSDETKRNYLSLELKKLERFFSNNLDFIKYLRTNNSHLDHKYFIRGAYDISIAADCFDYEKDTRFSTSHDYKVSKIKANELIEIYLKQAIANIGREMVEPMTNMSRNNTKLAWTNSKAALVELIYALHSNGAFNNRNTTVKEIATYFESIFEVDLSHFYNTYKEIKGRKGNQTQYLETLQNNLIKRINESDGK